MNLSAANDFAAHVEQLRHLPQHADPNLRTLFERGKPIYVARAPGRLDVMGGIGDYSGSLVLEMPIAEAAFAAVQITAEPTFTFASLRNEAVPSKSHAHVRTFICDEWQALLAGDYDSTRSYFAEDSSSAWAAYVAGSALVLLRETASKFTGGLRVFIDSRVPEGKGVSSSAAIEVATMRAVASALRVDIPGEELARLCQLAENRIVGAPCGIMDQMTSALGRENELLALRCQPATIEGFASIPKEIAFWGIDSGVRHSIGGADYSSVRCGAFMGYRTIADAAGLHAKRSGDDPNVLEVDDPTWNRYLANITPAEFQSRFAKTVPTEMTGREFLERYTGTTDHITRVDPARSYAVRAPTLFPIENNWRAERLRALLQNPISEATLREMGQLMFWAHDSYTACGLGSPATDLLVSLVRDASSAAGLYGAKITGGGSGGTVAILARSDAGEEVAAVARRYGEIAGRESYVFRGSSPGTYSTAVQELVI